jgi:hypothetical protein
VLLPNLDLVLGDAQRPPGVQVTKALEQLLVERVDLRGIAGEVRVNLEAVQIADNEQRRVVERFAVLGQFLIRRPQVLVLPRVFPAKLLIESDIRPAFAVVPRVHALPELR